MSDREANTPDREDDQDTDGVRKVERVRRRIEYDPTRNPNTIDDEAAQRHRRAHARVNPNAHRDGEPFVTT